VEVLIFKTICFAKVIISCPAMKLNFIINTPRQKKCQRFFAAVA